MLKSSCKDIGDITPNQNNNKQSHTSLLTVVTKIIRQASINFFHSLYLRYNKSQRSRIFTNMQTEMFSINILSFSSIDQAVQILLRKKDTQYDFSPSKIIRQVNLQDSERPNPNKRLYERGQQCHLQLSLEIKNVKVHYLLRFFLHGA